MSTQIESAPRRSVASATSSKRNKTLASAAFQKQLQTCIAVQCMSWVYQMEAMKLAQVHQKMFEGYHGNPASGTLPFLKDCLLGENAFEHLWDKVDSTDSGSTNLQLRNCFVQQENFIFCSGGSFTQVSLQSAKQSSPVLIDGRAIFNLAQNALKLGKKALAIEKSLKVNGNLPSGWNDDTLDKAILDGMWKHLNTSSPGDLEDDESQETETADGSPDNIAERPDGWIFAGWMAYRLFGPRAHPDFQSPLFSLGDWPKNKRGEKSSGGRSEVRKEKAAAEAATRLNAPDRGIPLGVTKKDLINIAQLEDRADARAHESSLLALSQVIESKQKTLANMTKMLEIPGISEDHKTRILGDIMKLMQVIQDKENLMEGLYNRKRKAPEVVSQLLVANTITPAVTSSGAATSTLPAVTNQNAQRNAASSLTDNEADDGISPCNLFVGRNA